MKMLILCILFWVSNTFPQAIPIGSGDSGGNPPLMPIMPLISSYGIIANFFITTYSELINLDKKITQQTSNSRRNNSANVKNNFENLIEVIIYINLEIIPTPSFPSRGGNWFLCTDQLNSHSFKSKLIDDETRELLENLINNELVKKYLELNYNLNSEESNDLINNIRKIVKDNE